MMAGMRRMRSSIRGAQSRSAARSLERMPNWYCARDCVVPMLIDCTGWKKTLMPGHLLRVARRSRAITSVALAVRSGLSRSMMKMRPELTVLAALPPPTVEISCSDVGIALDDLGQRLTGAPTMASNEASSGPTVEPVIWPMSSVREEALGDRLEQDGGQHEGRRA